MGENYTDFEKLAGVNSPKTEEMFYDLVKQAAWTDTMIKIAADAGQAVTPQDLGLDQGSVAQAAVVDATQKALKQQGVDPDVVVDQVAANLADDPAAAQSFLQTQNANDLGTAVVNALSTQQTEAANNTNGPVAATIPQAQ